MHGYAQPRPGLDKNILHRRFLKNPIAHERKNFLPGE
jgi:hypothetical protein